MATWRGRARGREHHVVGRIRVFGESVFFGESGLLENEPTVARRAGTHHTAAVFFYTLCAAVWCDVCVPVLRVPLVHSQRTNKPYNLVRKNKPLSQKHKSQPTLV